MKSRFLAAVLAVVLTAGTLTGCGRREDIRDDKRQKLQKRRLLQITEDDTEEPVEDEEPVSDEAAEAGFTDGSRRRRVQMPL